MDSDYDLSLLLTKWNLQHLFDHFKKHMIDIDVLKILKTHHITKLFEDLPIGQQAKFEFNLEKWNKQFNSSEILPVCQHITTTEQKIPTVTEILSNTRNGKDIQNYYNNNKTLHDEQRNLLINTITKYIESKNITCSLSDCMEIEKQIYNIFPTEKLIDIDFVLKYPVAKNFEECWPYCAEDLLFILKTRISCSLISKKLLQTERIDEDSKMFTILWYCHNLFPPQLKISTDENGAKYKKKFTIADSQESFAVVASTMDELETKLKLLKLQGRKIQPKLLVIGDTLKVSFCFNP
ncbi:hypothetical protein FF38_12548 [Lucilia cuprina]|uniref:Uncharacterized protein n=1 Tax=Lucilia cuprina TaxID=7375 RepID=A0A0L0BN35_LUCCU|nr:hypothetical protein FF38_12548 [Lucilia cuprina]